MRWYFAFFLVSGYCSLVYEIVWLGLAMAEFGVTTLRPLHAPGERNTHRRRK